MSTTAAKGSDAVDTAVHNETSDPTHTSTDVDDRCVAEVSAQTQTVMSRNRSSRLRRRWRGICIGLVVTGLAVSTSWLGLIHRGDAAAAEARETVAPAAAEAARAVLSYKPDTVTDDLARARSHLYGDFASYFSRLGTDVVIPAAQQRHMSSTATVTATSVASADRTEAVALVFVNQVTTSADQQQPTVTSSSLRLRLVRVDGRWLVTELDTV